MYLGMPNESIKYKICFGHIRRGLLCPEVLLSGKGDDYRRFGALKVSLKYSLQHTLIGIESVSTLAIFGEKQPLEHDFLYV